MCEVCSGEENVTPQTTEDRKHPILSTQSCFCISFDDVMLDIYTPPVAAKSVTPLSSETALHATHSIRDASVLDRLHELAESSSAGPHRQKRAKGGLGLWPD